MPRNGSGEMSPDVDFTTEAASPPIEIAKLDQVLADIADEITNSIAADGQTSPTADLKMNGFKHTNVGAATALTHYGRVTEIIDQDYIYYVDTGAADAYVITPSPAIAAYEEGQKFCFRAVHANTGASTLNVNGLGAIAIQTPDGVALAVGAIVLGGYYEVVYDANTSPDRWVLMSPPSFAVADFARLSQNNTFSGPTQTLANVNAQWVITDGTVTLIAQADGASGFLLGTVTNHTLKLLTNALVRLEISGAGNFDFKAGTVTTSGSSAAEVGTSGTVQNVQNGDYTLVLADRGKSIDKASGGSGETITIPANGSVAFPIGTVICGDNDGGGTLTIAITSDTLEDTFGNTGSRIVADNGFWCIKKIATTKWRITGAGLS